MLQDESLKMFVFLSEILGRRVIDSPGKSIGKVGDLRVKLGELFPKIIGVEICQKKGKQLLFLPWEEVQSIEGNIVQLKEGAEKKASFWETKPDEILLKAEILDKQVVDTYGAKIERVNDLHLLIAKNELRLVHVDLGVRGIFRRLKWIKYIDAMTNWLFAYQLPNKLLSWKYIQPLASHPGRAAVKLNLTQRKLNEIHPSDLADILEELDQNKRAAIFHSLDIETAAETLEEVDPKLKVSLLEAVKEEQASDIIEEMAPDKAADLLQDLSEEKKEDLIQGMEEEKREEIMELLQHEKDTAGSIMTTDYIALAQEKTAGEALEEFKKTVSPLETVSYVYVLDEDEKLVGILTLRDILVCPPETKLKEIMNQRVTSVNVDEDIDEVRDIFEKYDFLLIPVTDPDKKLKGIITLRDIIEATVDEFKQD
jgi:magnesium transporter